MKRRRLYFDERQLNREALDVLEASGELEVTEFELFRIAYRRWYGSDASDDLIERFYLPYMFKDRVPVWVRHFVREVLDRAEADTLDPIEYGIVPRKVSMDMYNKGLRYFLWLVIIVGTALTGAAAVAELGPWYSSCYFPPCY